MPVEVLLEFGAVNEVQCIDRFDGVDVPVVSCQEIQRVAELGFIFAGKTDHEKYLVADAATMRCLQDPPRLCCGEYATLAGQCPYPVGACFDAPLDRPATSSPHAVQ